MTLTLNEKEKKAIAAIVVENMDEHLTRFPYARFPVEPLEDWRKIFCDPKAVSAELLTQALSWQFGGWQRKDLALAHRKVISDVVKAWPQFVETTQDPEQLLTFWQDRLVDWQHGFGATALLLHLQLPDTFEIADRHRLDAMFELMKAIGHAEHDRTTLLSLADLQDFTAFFRVIFPKLPYGNDSRIKLDRFLKMYGNRHAYANLPTDFKTKEAIITTFSWETVTLKCFRLNQILNRSNADVLFACFLLTLEAENRSHEDLSIGEVIDRLPLGTGGICNPARNDSGEVIQKGKWDEGEFLGG